MAANLQDEIHRRAAQNRKKMGQGDNPLVPTPGVPVDGVSTDPGDPAFYAQDDAFALEDGGVGTGHPEAHNAGSGEPSSGAPAPDPTRIVDADGNVVSDPEVLAAIYNPETGALADGYGYATTEAEPKSPDDEDGADEPTGAGTDIRTMTLADLKAFLDQDSAEGYDKGWHKADYVNAVLDGQTVPALRDYAKSIGYSAADVNSLRKDELVALLSGDSKPST